jgi:hypothetical protein
MVGGATRFRKLWLDFREILTSGIELSRDFSDVPAYSSIDIYYPYARSNLPHAGFVDLYGSSGSRRPGHSTHIHH